MQQSLPILMILPFALTLACSSTPEAKAPSRSFSEAPQPATSREAALAPLEDDTGGYITVAKSIREACGISESEAYFGFNSAEIDHVAEPMLDRIAQCFTSGPLAKHSLRVVGHADPRGEDEYNMALGGYRADHVKGKLETRGLSPQRVTSTSRGESQAKGTDELSWARDRRVDLELGS